MSWINNQFQVRLLALGLFVILGGALLLFAKGYEATEAKQLLSALYAKEVAHITSKANAFIEEKRQSTQGLALALSHDAALKQQLKEGRTDTKQLEQLAHSLRDHSQYKNLWIRLQTPDGTTLAQSWPVNPGDSSAKTPIFSNQPNCEIRIDTENLGFHASSPIRDPEGKLLGNLVVISHFNSIITRLQELGSESLVLVQPQYRQQLSRPVSNTFIDDYYVANHHPNQKLVNLLRTKGITNLVSPETDFVFEPEQGLLVVNLSIFDRDQQPLANMLIFRPVADLESEVLHPLAARVHLMIAFGLLALVFALYIFSNRQGALPTQRSGSKPLLFVGVFLLLALLQIGLLHWIGEQRRDEYLNALSKDIRQHFNYVKSKYQDMAQAIFLTSINRQDTFTIMAEANQAPITSRKQLLALLSPGYEQLFQQQPHQLCFYLNTEQHFLCLHRPDTHSNDQRPSRPSVSWTNQQQQAIHGFENDLSFSGFRSLFPLIYKDSTGERTHLGSVEIAFSTLSFAKELAQHQSDKVGFLIPAAEAEGLTATKEQSRFTPSPVPGFYYQRDIYKQLKHAGIEPDMSALDDLEEVSGQLHKGQTFSRSSQDLHRIYSFIPLENPVTKELAAVLVLQSQDDFLAERAHYFRLLLAMGLLGALLISIFSWRSHEDKAHIQALLAKTQSILDAQNAIIVISDGVRLLDYNRQLLEFFGTRSRQILRARYACICEAFVQDDKFFHLGKVPAGIRWLDYLQSLPKREHIVSMRDSTGRPHAFAIALSRFEKLYIISFSNISDTMREHFDLAERVVRDKLTGAFNREFFAKHIQELIEESENQHLMLGVILFDIDHFKCINDTYGHARGDLVLIQVVQLANRTLRQQDLLIRWGGEEFLILAKVPSIEQLVRIAENLRSHLEADSHPEAGTVTCSFGLSLHQHQEPPETTLERADRALYRAKEQGRNRVEVEA